MQKTKKILIFSTSYYPFVGGAEVAVKEITDRISGFEFDLITAKQRPDLPRIEKIGNVNVFRIGVGVPILDKLCLPFVGAFLALRLNRQNSYDWFWCIMATFASGAAYIANFFIRKKVPIVLTLQEGDSEEYLRSRWFGLINLSWRAALRRTDIVTAISSYLAQRARRFGYEGEIKVIPNGVDLQKFEVRSVSYEEREKIRENLGLKRDDIALVTASRLATKNGIEDVIEALKLLPENIKFVICGIGDLQRSLELKSKSLGIEDRVLFKGYVAHDELPKILKACDIFIRPSLSEGMGNSFIEAMAAKLPVIATPVGGIVDFLKDGETGYFCEPQNPESIAGAVKRAISDGSRAEIIERAFALVKERYEWDSISSQMAEVLDKLTKRS